MVDLVSLENRVAHEVCRYQAGVSTCSLALQIGFFFDGRERNIYVDEEHHRLTNVGRLFRAHPLEIEVPVTSSAAYSKIYIPGLGTPLNDTSVEQMVSVIDARQKEVFDNYLDGWKEQGKEAVVDTVKGVAKGEWSKVLSRKVGEVLSMKSGYLAALAAAKNAAKRAVAEAIAPVRDNRIVHEMFVTGVDARVDYAKNNFRLSVDEVKKTNQLPIKLIQISVFGADTGGVLARRFIDELLESVCRKSGDEYYYEQAKVEVNFVGLFDCSRRSLFDSGDVIGTGAEWAGMIVKNPALVGAINILAGRKVIEFDKPLHRAVKKALHLVAAHERREYRPLLPLGKLQNGWHERLCPGISEDVTGGLLPNPQRPSAELCRVLLQQMYKAAWNAGVPFPFFSTLKEKDKYLASYFVMLDDIAGKSAEFFSDFYTKYVRAAFPAWNTTAPTAMGFECHMIVYLRWLAWKINEYREEYKTLSWSQKSELEEEWGWLADIFRDAGKVKITPGMPEKVTNAAGLILNYRGNPVVPQPYVDALFNYYMHDFASKELKHATLYSQANTLLRSNNFFIPRGIEELADEEQADA